MRVDSGLVPLSPDDPPKADKWGTGRPAAWVLLASLLAATLAGAYFYDRAGWPGRLAGESTYLMQAASLAVDFDLTYTRDDFDRMLLADLGNPTDLSLVSGSEGRRIAFDRPFPYALYLAPFVKLWPRQGFAIANALLLAFVSIFAARTLERQAGAWSPVWVAVLLFASVLFAYVFLVSLLSLPFARYYQGTVLLLPSALCAALVGVWYPIRDP